MITLHYLDDDKNEMDVNVIIVEKSDIRIPYDTYIRSIEVEDGWWELYNIDGYVCGYFEEDEEY